MTVTLKDLPVDVGVVFEGERVRWKDTRIEYGGPRVEQKFELCKVVDPDSIEDERVIVRGPDIPDTEPQTSHELGILIEMAGEKLERDLEAVFERRVHEFTNFISGAMHLNQRYDIHIRISKKTGNKGFTLKDWGNGFIALYKATFPIIEKIQITFYTDPQALEELYSSALDTYSQRDARARELKDEEIDTFYGCVLCQSFAPTHVCVISPNRISSCGSINWFDARAAAKVDPEGPNFEIKKGELLNPDTGEYTGVNEHMKERSMGEVSKVEMYSMFSNPHTSCGCFEAIAFYIPEVDGMGVVHRDFKGESVNGLPFSTMATQTGGGQQVPGFNGIAIEYLRSPKFLYPEGGIERLVWLPKAVKDRVPDAFTDEFRPKVATEEEVSDIDSLKAFLQKQDHPIVKRWTSEPEVVPVGEAPSPIPQEAVPAAAPATTIAAPAATSVAIPTGANVIAAPTITLPIMLPPGASGGSGGSQLKLILNNVKINIDKVYIKKKDEE